MSVSVQLTDGSSVIVFQTLQGAFYERLDASFHTVGSPALLTSANVPWVSAVALPNGGFGFVWDSGVADAGPIGLSERDFNSAGVETGSSHPGVPPAPVELAFTSDASVPLASSPQQSATAVLPDGGYVQASASQTNGNGSLHVQRFDAQGAAVGPAHTIGGPGALSSISTIEATPLENGGFAVAFVVNTQHAATLDVQTWGPDDQARAGSTVVSYSGGQTDIPTQVSLVGLPDGGYALSWIDNPPNGATSGTLQVAEFHADGTAAGAVQSLGPADTGQPTHLAAVADGHYTVGWTSGGVAHQQVFSEAQFSQHADNGALVIADPSFAIPNGVHVVSLEGSAAQSVTGNALDNSIFDFGTGPATMSGGAGDDALMAGHGPDVMTGGAGADSFSFKYVPTQAGHVTDFTHGVDKLDLTSQLAPVYHGTNPIADGYIRLEAAAGGGTNVIFDSDGRGPNDAGSLMTTLDGVAPGQITVGDFKGFADPVSPPPGGSGQVLTGSDGGSNLTGGSGADTLVGGHGADTFTGGAGADDFTFRTLPWNAGQITDFAPGTDKLDLTALLSQSGYHGTDPIADGYVKLLDDGHGDTWLYYDTDGHGTADQWGTFVATIQHVAPGAIHASDLVGFGAASPPPPPPASPPPPANGGQVLIAADGGSDLHGGAGADTLVAGHGPDSLTGAGGADDFTFKVLPWSAGHITDFTPGTDKIDLTTLLSNAGYHGSDPIADGYVKLLDDGHGDTWLYFDTDGHGTADQWGTFVATIDHVAPGQIHASDFGAGASPPPPAGGGQAFVVFAGQSNMGGLSQSASTLPANWQASPLIQIWNPQTSHWEEMQPGTNTGYAGFTATWGPEVEFAIDFHAAHPNDTLRIVKSVAGGTPLAATSDAPDWSPQSTGELFDQTTAEIQQASAAAGGALPTMLFWGQGEEDATHAADASAYAQNLTGFFAAARSQWLHNPNADIGYFRIGSSPPFSNQVQAAELQVDQADPNAASFETVDYPYQSDSLHYSTAGLEQVGDQFFQLYNTWTGGAASPPPPPASPPPPPASPPPPPAASGVVLTSSGPGDTLTGGPGDDTLNASRGSDQLTGGGGNDRFVFGDVPWSPAHITDFTHGQDVLDLRGVFAHSTYTSGDPVAEGYLSFISDGNGGTKVLFDSDGPAAGQQWESYILNLDHVDPATMTSADWIVR